MPVRAVPTELDESFRGILGDYGHLEGWQRGRHSFPKLVGTVTLDSDVYDVFRTSEEVNNALRMLIHEGRVPHLAR